MNQISDAELINKCKRGDKSSFGIIVDRYKDKVYNTVLRMVGNPQDAEDISQEAFISSYRTINKFDVNRDFAPWLLKIAINLSIDYLRQKRPQNVPLDFAEFESHNIPDLSYAEDQLNALELSELHDILEDSILKLPYKYRAVVALYYMEEHTYGEIADILEIPMGTVKTYLYRGREMLKAQMKDVLADSLRV